MPIFQKDSNNMLNIYFQGVCDLSKAFLLWWIQVVTVSFAGVLIFTYGWFEKLYDADQTKISFIIILILLVFVFEIMSR